MIHHACLFNRSIKKDSQNTSASPLATRKGDLSAFAPELAHLAHSTDHLTSKHTHTELAQPLQDCIFIIPRPLRSHHRHPLPHRQS